MRVEPDGPVPCDLALFGEAPGFHEQQEGRGFVGKSGEELWTALERHCGLSRANFYVSNLVKDGLPKNRDPKPAEISAALPEFFEELARVRPRIVVTAGKFAMQAMLGSGLKQANVHGIPHTAVVAGREYLVHPIYHPAAGLHNKGFLAAFAYDLGRLKGLLSGQGKPWAPARLPRRVEWLLGPATWLDGLSGGKPVAVDTEGWPDKPAMVQFAVSQVDCYVIPATATKALAWFRSWIRKHRVILHSGITNDLGVLAALDILFDRYDDTQVMAYHHMLATGSGVLEAESQNLGTLAYREIGMVLGELTDCPGVDLASRVIPFSEEVKQYAGEDALATFRLATEVYWPWLEREPGIRACYEIDMGQTFLVRRMMDAGMPFDEDAVADYYLEMLDKEKVLRGELRSMAARRGHRDFNPGSHPQVRELVTRRYGLRVRKRTKGGKASTNEKALAEHKEHPFVAKLQEHREVTKLIGTYLEPLMEELA